MTQEDFKDIADRIVDEENTSAQALELVRAYLRLPCTLASKNILIASLRDLFEAEATAHFQRREPVYYSNRDEHEDGRFSA